MPAISKIRLTNVVYEDGDKRFNDEIFLFDGHNGAILLENGGGKTVFIHTVLQAILPHTHLGERKIKETLQLENAPAHIAIEWIINERPRRYMTTAVNLFLYNNKLGSYRYVFEYEHGNSDGIEHMPFVKETNGNKRPAYKEEISDYYSQMKAKTHNARTFDTISGFHTYIEENYQIITNEWESIVKINRDEGGIEKFFENCKTTTDLYDRLLIPTVEDSIVGHEEGMFADMFEKQREGFQTYRNLQKSMAEHKAIQAELENYVAQFKLFSDTQAAYEVAKEKAKGLAGILLDQQVEMEKERTENECAWKKYGDDELNLERQTASYHLLEENVKTESLEAAYLEKLANYEETADRLAENERLFTGLMYAKFKEERITYEQRRKQYQTELENRDEQEEAADLETELERENAILHGWFLSQLEKIEKTLATAERERRPLIETRDDLTRQIDTLTKERNTENDVLNRLVGQLEIKQDDSKNLLQYILAQPDQENVQVEYEKWIARGNVLDEEIIRLDKKKREAKQRTEELQAERETRQRDNANIDLQIQAIKQEAKQLEHAHESLVKKLAEIRPSWQTIDDLHLKEGSVYGPLIDLEKKLAREREELMYKERLALRFVDDYGEQESFFTDAFLADRLADWRNSFFILTGVEYVADLPEADRVASAAYPLWPLTLVTTATEKEKLISKVTEVKQRLQYPIIILTLEEAKQIGETVPKETWISPAHWESNLNTDSFQTWKENVREVAEVTTVERREKEAELTHCKEVINAFEQFFHQYPKEKRDTIRETLRTLQTEKEQIGRTIDELEKTIDQTKREILKTEETIEQYRDEKNGLDGRVEKATDYFKLEREITDLTKQQQEREYKRTQYDKEIRSLERALDQCKEDIQHITDRIIDIEHDKRIVKADAIYQEVQTYQAIFTDEAKAVIMERREELNYRLRGIQQQYGEIRAKYEEAEKDVRRVEAAMVDLVRSHEEIDTDMTFPIDGDRIIERTREAVRTGKAETQKRLAAMNEAKEQFIGQNHRVETLMEQFEKDFPEQDVVEFDMNLEEIGPYLETIEKKLAERKAYLKAETNRIEKELKAIEAASQHLVKYEVAHHFNRTTVNAIPLSEKELLNFTYDRMTFVKAATNELELKKSELDKGKETIDTAKRHFRAFCRKNITERKLREMATEGIEVKTTYNDVLEFRQNMVTTVERADQYARNYISEKDKEVQAFINSIHNHLLNVTAQLRAIPRNTRVKVGEKYKEIFLFTIPNWTEEDGKTRIRNHMDWILEQLEADQYKNEQGLEDSGKVRKEVENWLHTKQLLQIVMDHKGMKVSCRKVTNDNQVTSRLTSWEQSNQWSGGEKWSKNMTLFLGILNFVAEKKQHIATKMKRHRAVILDNPFGKASSDHVLNPVFYIAEQLGFQILALTAHADGKFLQDYFPIIYSCRLRASTDESVQIMTKEKSLHHAYFRDHEPGEMERLEEREQMELF